MAQVIYARRAYRDLDRLMKLGGDDPAVIALIAEVVELLSRHPQIGRPAEHELRELVISRGTSGYLALYDHDRESDLVAILAIRHQREAGYEPHR